MVRTLLANSASKRGGRLPAFLLAALLPFCAGSPAMSQPATGYNAGPAQAGSQAGRTEPGEQVFHIMTVHLDAKTNVNGDAGHPPEPFPESAAASSGGLIVRRPDEKGDWSVRAFVFQPSQLVVKQGDKVVLNFVGVQGPSFMIALDGHHEQIPLKRGEVKTVRFVAEQPGTIRFASVGREPTMQGSILVLRRE